MLPAAGQRDESLKSPCVAGDGTRAGERHRGDVAAQGLLDPLEHRVGLVRRDGGIRVEESRLIVGHFGANRRITRVGAAVAIASAPGHRRCEARTRRRRRSVRPGR